MGAGAPIGPPFVEWRKPPGPLSACRLAYPWRDLPGSGLGMGPLTRQELEDVDMSIW